MEYSRQKNGLLQEDLTWAKWILKIFDFSAIPYAWYIEMWIGLNPALLFDFGTIFAPP